MLLRVVDCNRQPKQHRITDTLQDLCYEKLIENTWQLTSQQISELSKHCLDTLADRFSLKDVIRFDSVLEKRGVNLAYIYSKHLAKGVKPQEVCLVRDTVLPQSLHLLSDKVWDSNLSQHLYRQIFHPIFDEHEMLFLYGDRYGRPEDYLRNIVTRYPGLKQMFIPVPEHEAVSWDEPIDLEHMLGPQSNSHDSIIELMEKAALRIMYISMDTRFYHFFLNRMNDGILKALASTLCAITIRLHGGTAWLDVVHRLLMQSKSLKRITLYCLSVQDTRYLDMVLSKCSGVTRFYTTSIGFKEKNEFKFKYFRNHSHFTQNRAETKFQQNSQASKSPEDPAKEEEPPRVSSISALLDSEEEYLSDDEEIVNGLSEFDISKDEESFSGVTSFGFQVSNMVPRELYRNVLDHHFQHWHSLVELEFAPPKIDKEMAACLSGVIRRPTFKSLTLTQCYISSCVLDDILSSIAMYRRGAPMDALILVGLTHPTAQMEEATANNADEVAQATPPDPFGQSRFFVSDRLQSAGAFEGTRVLELSGKRLDSKTQHLLWQFIYCDKALQQLYIVNTMDSQLVCPLLCSLAHRESQPLSHLNLEYCGFNEGDIVALTMFLASQSKTLLSLSLKGSFCFRDPNDVRDIAAAIRQCENLRSLSLEHCNLASSAMMFVEQVLSPSLKNLCLSNNKITVRDAIRIIRYLSMCSKPKKPTLDVLDFRNDSFLMEHLDRNRLEGREAARRILCDERACIGLFKLMIPQVGIMA